MTRPMTVPQVVTVLERGPSSSAANSPTMSPPTRIASKASLPSKVRPVAFTTPSSSTTTNLDVSPSRIKIWPAAYCRVVPDSSRRSLDVLVKESSTLECGHCQAPHPRWPRKPASSRWPMFPPHRFPEPHSVILISKYEKHNRKHLQLCKLSPHFITITSQDGMSCQTAMQSSNGWCQRTTRSGFGRMT
jgi:hypothetical protein